MRFLVLVPWKRVVLVWGLLTAMILIGFTRRCCKELIIHLGREPPVPRRQLVLRMPANKNIRRKLLKTQATENVIVILGAPRSCFLPAFFAPTLVR